MEELASSSIDHICRVLEFFLPDENSRRLYAFVFDLRSFAGRLGPSGAVTAIFFFPRVSDSHCIRLPQSEIYLFFLLYFLLRKRLF